MCIFLIGFDVCMDTPVELLHVYLLCIVKYLTRDFMSKIKAGQTNRLVVRYHSFNTNGLNILSLKASYMTKHFANFVGKEFKVVPQAAPFVFFDDMDDGERALWISLCKLSPLIFATRIEDMNNYIQELEAHIQKFLLLLAGTTAHWVNKPKVHLLLHLLESIRCFGPGSLFATKKFESYNSILRKASIHSNRWSPGRDIAVTFANFRNIFHLLLGGYYKDNKTGKHVQAATAVTEVFSENPMVQRTMGMSLEAGADQADGFPNEWVCKVASSMRVAILVDLAEFVQVFELTQLSQVNLILREVILAGSFMLVSTTSISWEV
jgi:thymidine kinase